MKRIGAVASIIVAVCLVASNDIEAAMSTLADTELSTVTGRAGISIDMDLAVQVAMDSFRIADTSPTKKWLEFNGVTIDDGAGNPFSMKTSDGFITSSPITYDVSTDAAGRTSLTIVDSSKTYPRHYNVSELKFADQSLGSLHIGPMTEGPSTLRISAPIAGSGIEFDYTTRLDIGVLKYAYNSSNSLALSGVHLFGSASGAPEDPASWAMTGNFHIGEHPADKPNPASIVVGAELNDVTSTYINLPMQGSLRVENVAFGPTSFGPMAIDGINVHRLQLRLTP